MPPLISNPPVPVAVLMTPPLLRLRIPAVSRTIPPAWFVNVSAPMFIAPFVLTISPWLRMVVVPATICSPTMKADPDEPFETVVPEPSVRVLFPSTVR